MLIQGLDACYNGVCVNDICVPGQSPQQQRRPPQFQQANTTPRPTFLTTTSRPAAANSLSHSNGRSFARTFENVLNRQSGAQAPIVLRQRPGSNVVRIVARF